MPEYLPISSSKIVNWWEVILLRFWLFCTLLILCSLHRRLLSCQFLMHPTFMFFSADDLWRRNIFAHVWFPFNNDSSFLVTLMLVNYMSPLRKVLVVNSPFILTEMYINFGRNFIKKACALSVFEDYSDNLSPYFPTLSKMRGFRGGLITLNHSSV